MGCFPSRHVPATLHASMEAIENIPSSHAKPLLPIRGEYGIGRALDIYDGDTFTMMFIHHGITFKHQTRMYGYDAPEMGGRAQSQRERDLGIKSREHLRTLLGLTDSEHSEVLMFKVMGADKYGRLLCQIWNIKQGHLDITQAMIEAGFGKPYDGKGPKPKW